MLLPFFSIVSLNWINWSLDQSQKQTRKIDLRFEPIVDAERIHQAQNWRQRHADTMLANWLPITTKRNPSNRPLVLAARRGAIDSHKRNLQQFVDRHRSKARVWFRVIPTGPGLAHIADVPATLRANGPAGVHQISYTLVARWMLLAQARTHTNLLDLFGNFPLPFFPMGHRERSLSL